MKKILISLAIMIAILVSPAISKAVLVESPKPYDYKNGLLDDKDLMKSNNLPEVMYDNNTSTQLRINNNTYTIEFKYPVKIEGFFYYLFSAGYTFKFTFVGGNTEVLSIETPSNIWRRKYVDTNFSQITKITINTPKSDVSSIGEIDFFGSYEKDVKVYDKTHTLTANSTANSIDLNWINPNLIGFQNVLLYVNGKLKDTLGTDVTSYKLTKLDPDTSYQIELIAKYDDEGLSEKEILTVNTKKLEQADKEVQSLTAKATHERVDLSWELPIYKDTFKHVNIYRGLEDTDIERLQLNRVKPSSKTVKKIFETNGTYFNDLTVEPSTTYDYKLTVTETTLNETEGILTRVTTAPKPAPEIKNPVISKEGDDYIVTWTNDEGKVKIDVDGKAYKEVDASTKKLIIPAKDMKYDSFGKPLITITYVDIDGESSKPSKPSQSGPGFEDTELKLPFTVGTLLKVIMDLIKILGPFILLALAIGFAPKIIDLIKKSSRRGDKK